MDNDKIDKLMKVCEAFRELKHDITLSQVMTFLYIAANENGVTTEDIQELLNVSQAAASRNLRIFDYQSNKGLGLVDIMMSRDTANLKLRVLSPDGKTLLAKIEEIMG